MIRHLLIPCLILMIQGCTVLSPENELRVTGYEGTVEPPALGAPIEGEAQAEGCRVVQKGRIEGCLQVVTKHCTYQSAACP